MEMVKVPPETSLPVSCSRRAFSISSSRPAAMPFSDRVCTLRSTGTIRPFSPSAVPTPMLTSSKISSRSSCQRLLIAGATFIASAAAATM